MKNKSNKIFKTILSIIMSFLIIFIAAMFTRSITSNILPKNSKISMFVNDYLDMMMQKVDSIAVNLKMKRNSVSQYQVDLISQSISDYVGYSLSQTSDLITSYNPSKKTSDLNLDEYKKSYYKMTVENPYLRSMTVFNTDGKMTLNLYLSGNKSWPIELNKNLIENIKNKGSYVIHATNENSFYIMQYMKNKYGEFVVATRNDYSYISDIALYYQVADKTLYVSDSQSSMYTVKEAEASKNIDNISSVISRFAFYKKQPTFEVGESIGLSVALVGKEYPNYFELIVLGVTAFFIVLFQFIIKGLLYFFGYITNAHKKKIEDFPMPDDDIPMIDEDIIKSDLPKSMAYESVKENKEVVHKIDVDEYDIDEYDVYEEESAALTETVEVKKEFLYNSNIIDNVEQIEPVEIPTHTSSDFIINTVFKTNSIQPTTEKIIEEKENIIEDIIYTDIAKENEIVEEVVIKTVASLKNNIKEDIQEQVDEKAIYLEKNIFSLDTEDTSKEKYDRTEDVFSAFDRMLSSIITKAEQDARDTLAKKS